MKKNKTINNINTRFGLYPQGIMRYRPLPENPLQDLIIIGGGIMGLMTAYYACLLGKKVTILEKKTIGNKDAASFSLTRSLRNDYIDPTYAKLSNKAKLLWEELERELNKELFIQCGCLNLFKKTITPKEKETYAVKSYETLLSLNLKTKKFSKKSLPQKFSQFSVDAGYLDCNGGFLYLPRITKSIVKELKNNNVTIVENISIESIREEENVVDVLSDKGIFSARKIVVTSGIWTNEVLKIIDGCTLQFPITPDRPSECKYYIPTKEKEKYFLSNNFPVFAYLDIGIYGHPIYAGKTPGVKIGYYNPPDILKKETQIKSIADFVRQCMPMLEDAKVIDVKNADRCSYDMVVDKNFIVGKLPDYKNIFVGTGWNGTGYKFAPIIGKILSELISTNETSYDIKQFIPERFKNYEK